MNDHDITTVDVDDVWVQEWAALLVTELELSLEKHAAFDEFLRRRADGSDN